MRPDRTALCVVVRVEFCCAEERLVVELPYSIVEFDISSVVQLMVTDVLVVVLDTLLISGAVESATVIGNQSIAVVVALLRL